MLGRHYAPGGTLRIVDDLDGLELDVGAGLVGTIGFGEAPASSAHHLSLPRDPGEYARLLYAALHTLDELG